MRILLHVQFVPGSQTYAAAEAGQSIKNATRALICGNAHGLRGFPIGAGVAAGACRHSQVEPVEALDRETLRHAGTRLAMKPSELQN